MQQQKGDAHGASPFCCCACENRSMARRRWIADAWGEHWAALTGAQARHLALVLRAEAGARYDVVAGAKVWSAIVEAASAERVEFTLEAELPADPALPLTLLLAVFKFDRMEWAVEKATELGVERISPLLARRTEKHLAQASVARVVRWRRIAQEAAKQSRRADIPVIDDPRSVHDAVTGAAWHGVRILLDEAERVVLLSDVLRMEKNREALSLAVGPEGGWTPDEVEVFARNDWQPASLGPRILRAETAAIAATAVAAAALLR